MKRLLITFFVLLLTIGLYADGVKIRLYKTDKRHTEERSIQITPLVYQDGNVIYLYSDIPIEQLQVTIKDEIGQIISLETISIQPRQSYTLFIDSIENGDYILELNDGKEEYHGYFKLE